MVDASSAEVYLISSGWLHTSLKSIAQALMTIEDEVSEGKTSTDAKQLVADRVPAQSQCLPIYAPSSSKLGASKNLNGVFIVQDPFVGHIAYLRLDSKQLIAINITMHTKLCQLQMSIQVSKVLRICGYWNSNNLRYSINRTSTQNLLEIFRSNSIS